MNKKKPVWCQTWLQCSADCCMDSLQEINALSIYLKHEYMSGYWMQCSIVQVVVWSCASKLGLIAGIYFQNTTGLGNKRKVSLKCPKIKTFENSQPYGMFNPLAVPNQQLLQKTFAPSK